MKICQIHQYKAPAKDSMGAERVVESLTRALIRQGHEVVMKIHPDSTDAPAPVVKEIPEDCDILHFQQWHPWVDHDSFGKPWIATIHGGGGEETQEWRDATKDNPHVVCVSKFIQDLVGGVTHAWTCSDPKDFIYSKDKDDYFLWLGGTDWGESKGLFSTIQMAKKLRIKLIIAGTGRNQKIIEQIKALCDDRVTYVGAANGEKKAKLFSKAKALILLTQLRDACPVTVSEALLSGTPIIASNNGAMPELVDPKVGFIVNTPSEFAKAIMKIGSIKPEDCYEYGLERFSNDAIAKRYVQIYENMLRFGRVA